MRRFQQFKGLKWLRACLETLSGKSGKRVVSNVERFTRCDFLQFSTWGVWDSVLMKRERIFVHDTDKKGCIFFDEKKCSLNGLKSFLTDPELIKYIQLKSICPTADVRWSKGNQQGDLLNRTGKAFYFALRSYADYEEQGSLSLPYCEEYVL
jgi:hypothetical protein